MMKLTIRVTGNELWDRIAGLVNGEAGEIVGSPLTNGNQFYNAVFPNYGEVTWIPAKCAELSENTTA
jgi:hypothetical protein